MKVIVKAILVKRNNVEVFNVEVSEYNYILIRKKLDQERNKIVDIFKGYLSNGLIKSLKKPKNKAIQKEINLMVKAKKDALNSINIIKEIYYK